jgi:hypothetical protein
MTVKVKHTASKRPTKTMSEAFICSGVLFIVTARFRKAFVLDISFRNGAATTAPSHYCYKNCAAE